MESDTNEINKTAILLIATLATFLTPFLGTSLIVALPTIANDLAVNAILLSWVGPVLGGFLTQYLGWRSIFYLIVPLGLLVLVLVFWKMRGEWAGCIGEKLDYWGSLLYIIMLSLILVGFSSITGTVGVVMVSLGIIGLVGFVIWELRVENPVLNMSLFFKNRRFAFSNLAAFISYMGLSTVSFLLSLYLQYIKGLDPKITGLILVVQTVFMVLISPFAGRLSDRYDLLTSIQIIYLIAVLLSIIAILASLARNR